MQPMKIKKLQMLNLADITDWCNKDGGTYLEVGMKQIGREQN